jgi:hypothetical protein
METKVARAMLETIRGEQDRRLRDPHENTLVALDQWADVDQPLISEMVLVLLIAIRHGVERELIWLAAGHSPDGREIGADEYWKRIKAERKSFGDKPQEFIGRFRLDTLPRWTSMEVLRHMANCYKHEPLLTPSKSLLECLGMPLIPQTEPLEVIYASLPESLLFRQGLASWLTLDRHADYCAIADSLLNRVDEFLAAANHAIPRNVKLGYVSLRRFEG